MSSSRGIVSDGNATDLGLIPGRRWPLSYGSIQPIVCALDAAFIIAVSLATGALYGLIFHTGEIDLVRHAATGIVVSTAFIPIFRNQGLYAPSALLNWNLQARNIIILWILTFLALAGVAFALKIGRDFSRGAVLSFCAFGLLVLLAHRAFWRVSLQAALEKGTLRGPKAILLAMHDGPGVRSTREIIQDLTRHGFEIQRSFQFGGDATQEAVIQQGIAFATGSDVEEIFLSADLQRWTDIQDLVRQLRVLPLPLTVLPDERTSTLFQRPSRQFGRLVGVEFQRPPLTVSVRALKRLLDIVCAVGAIIALAPMFVIVTLAVKADSPGPAMFLQTRHGFNRKRFKIFKFRTMSVLEDGATVRQAVRDDKRITCIGMWLRKTSIDELPQLFNVLNGDMSIVGPRPHAVAHDSYYADLIGNYAFRHHMKPGITGWAQVHGYRGETPTIDVMERRVDLDLWYVDNWSLMLDVQIILRTAAEVLRGRNAY